MSDVDILPGAEPFFFQGNDIGILVCHGLTGTTQSMRYLGERLHAAGYTVIGPRLKGHGVSPAAMAKTTAADWVDSVDEALGELRKTCSKVFMAGLSMGGTLTLYSAAMYPDLIHGAITINAAVQLSNPDMASSAFDRRLPEMLPGIGSDIKDPATKELAYSEVPIVAFRHAYSLIAVTYDLLPRVKCPTLVITAREDHVVNPNNGPIIASKVGSNRVDVQWLEDSYHVATIDNDKDLIAERTINFVRSIAGR